MDTAEIMQYAPKIIFILIAAGLLFELRRYKRKNDVTAWLRGIYAKTTRAATDEDFRQSELADAEAQIAKCPVPNPVVPISNKQQIRVAAFPKFVFMAALSGTVFLYFGLFETLQTGVRWPIFVGWAFLALTLILYLFSESARKYYSRVQQINRKYLLQKAGGEAARFDSLRQVLEYYPHLSELWMELGDQYAVAGQMDKAVEAMDKARECAPNNIDLAIVKASFELRRKHAQSASKTLDEAETLKTAPTDPRVDMYRAALALQNNEKKKAEKHGKKALELDKGFAAQLLDKDEALRDLAIFIAPLLCGGTETDTSDRGTAGGDAPDETAETEQE